MVLKVIFLVLIDKISFYLYLFLIHKGRHAAKVRRRVLQIRAEIAKQDSFKNNMDSNGMGRGFRARTNSRAALPSNIP